MTSKELGIFNQKPFFFWVKDAEGTYLWVNDALNEMAEEGVVGKKDTELPWADAAEFLKRQPGYKTPSFISQFCLTRSSNLSMLQSGKRLNHFSMQ